MRALRVLYIEDDKKVCVAISRSLAKEGFSVRCAETMAEAIKIVDDPSLSSWGLSGNVPGFDVILLDITLPDSAGVESVRRVAERTKVPIVVFSGAGDSDSEIAKAARAAGAVEWAPKGASIPVLARMLKIAYGRVRGGELLSAYVRR